MVTLAPPIFSASYQNSLAGFLSSPIYPQLFSPNTSAIEYLFVYSATKFLYVLCKCLCV